jgi:hypothetical protein
MNTPEKPDELVPDPKVAAEFGVTPMTLWRWDNDPALDFPAEDHDPPPQLPLSESAGRFQGENVEARDSRARPRGR